MKLIIARNEDAINEIIKSAMNSFVGQMIYRKWDKSTKNFERKRYKVIPLDCGKSKRNNDVLYVQDYSDGKRTKMFLLKQIEKFQCTQRKSKPYFPIKVQKLKSFLKYKDNNSVETTEEV